jgi:aminoglycoside phosphotransferase (APT) family kinase protein
VAVHPNQLEVTVDTVRSLVASQFPDWSDLPVRAVVTHGTVNALFRVGDQLAARFPLVPGDPLPSDLARLRRWLESEADAARELLGRTRFPTPEPVALGEPGAGYPLPWSVQTWVPGTVATEADPAESVGFAHDLAEFVEAVRTIDTRGRTFSGSGRGGELVSQDAWLETCFANSERLLDVPTLRRMWASLRELPRGGRPDIMNHGDLMPGNLLVAGGRLDGVRLAGVIDVGGLGPADPALDLVGAWHVLDAVPRRAFRDRLGCDDEEWERGKGWAFAQSMGLVWYYADTNPTMAAIGSRTLDRLVADASEVS